MPAPLVLVTGFGAFPGTERNPSREVAFALELAPPPGVRVRAGELPVTFEGAPPAIDALIASLSPERPDILLGLGVQKLSSFRLERRARGRLAGARLDNAGRVASELGIDAGPDRETEFDLAPLARVLSAAGAPEVIESEDAGGYVCERTYHRLLTRAEELGVPALFLHVPPAAALAPERQVPIVRALVAELVRRAR